MVVAVRLIYIGNASDSVYETQSRALVDEFRRSGIDVQHLEGLKFRDFFKGGSLFCNFKERRFPILPVFPGLIFMQFLFLAVSVVRVFGFSKSVFHVRSDVLGSIFVRFAWILGIKEEQIVIDVRGATYWEFIDYRFRPGHCLSELRKLSLNFLRQSLRGRNCKFTAVSPALSDYVADAYSVKCEVVPCISPFKWTPPPAPQKKLQARLELGLPTHSLLVVAVNGGGSPWQLPIKDIDSIASESLLVLNLSSREADSPFVITRYLNGEDYEKALLASDAALMIRADSVVNRVAVPVKYLEYAAKSLPIIANGSVDSVTDYIESTTRGIIVDSLEEITPDLVQSLVSTCHDTAHIESCEEWLQSHAPFRVAEQYQGVYARVFVGS